MAARLRFLLPAISLLLAGCTGGSHDHGSHGEPALLLGLANELGSPANATWVVLTPNATVAWQSSMEVQPGKTEEKLHEIRGAGDHTIRVGWSGQASGNGTVTYDPTDCAALTHIILTLAPEGLAETKRECHD